MIPTTARPPIKFDKQGCSKVHLVLHIDIIWYRIGKIKSKVINLDFSYFYPKFFSFDY